MPRVKGGNVARKRRKKILKLAKGYRGGRSKLFRTAKNAVIKSLTYSYRDRKRRKRDFRRLWIIRINAAAREHGLSYSKFMVGLKKANILLDRRVLANLAIEDAAAFAELVGTAKAALENSSQEPVLSSSKDAQAA
jgi:large subunit ribosomal protein L20